MIDFKATIKETTKKIVNTPIANPLGFFLISDTT